MRATGDFIARHRRMDGAGDAAVRIRLADAVTTLLGLDAGRVAVYEREGGR